MEQRVTKTISITPNAQKVLLGEKLSVYLRLCFPEKKMPLDKIALIAFLSWLAWTPCGLASETSVLIRQRNAQQVESFIEQLQDADAEVRGSAVYALEEIGSDAAVLALIDALKDADAEVRQTAAFALGRIGSDTAVLALVDALQDADAEVHRRAIYALRRIDSDAAVSALIDTLQGSDNIRQHAAIALGEIGSETAVPALIDTLQDSNGWVLVNTIIALGEIGSDAAVPALIDTLQDSNGWVLVNTIIALGEIGSDAAVPALIDMLQDPSAEVRGSAVNALTKTDSEAAVPALIEQINNSAETAINRYRSINAFTHQHHLEKLANSSGFLPVLEDLALREEEDYFIRYGAFLILSSVNTPEAIHILNAHRSEFLALIEINYSANLPFYLPEPLNPDGLEPLNPIDEPTIIAAIAPYQAPPVNNSLPMDIFPEPIIPAIPQGANPGETKEETIALLDGKPAVCRLPWVARNWSRCSS